MPHGVAKILSSTLSCRLHTYTGCIIYLRFCAVCLTINNNPMRDEWGFMIPFFFGHARVGLPFEISFVPSLTN